MTFSSSWRDMVDIEIPHFANASFMRKQMHVVMYLILPMLYMLQDMLLK